MIKFSNFYTLQYICIQFRQITKQQIGKIGWNKCRKRNFHCIIVWWCFKSGNKQKASAEGCVTFTYFAKTEVIWAANMQLIHFFSQDLVNFKPEMKINKDKYRNSLKFTMDISKSWLFSALYCRPFKFRWLKVILIHK